jgi:hypothetical protein
MNRHESVVSRTCVGCRNQRVCTGCFSLRQRSMRWKPSNCCCLSIVCVSVWLVPVVCCVLSVCEQALFVLPYMFLTFALATSACLGRLHCLALAARCVARPRFARASPCLHSIVLRCVSLVRSFSCLLVCGPFDPGARPRLEVTRFVAFVIAAAVYGVVGASVDGLTKDSVISALQSMRPITPPVVGVPEPVGTRERGGIPFWVDSCAPNQFLVPSSPARSPPTFVARSLLV